MSLAPLAKRLPSYARTRGCKMPTPSSGAISMSDLNNEFAYGLSLYQNAFIYGVAPRTPIQRSVSLSQMYNKSNQFKGIGTCYKHNTTALNKQGCYLDGFSQDLLYIDGGPVNKPLQINDQVCRWYNSAVGNSYSNSVVIDIVDASFTAFNVAASYFRYFHLPNVVLLDTNNASVVYPTGTTTRWIWSGIASNPFDDPTYWPANSLSAYTMYIQDW